MLQNAPFQGLTPEDCERLYKGHLISAFDWLFHVVFVRKEIDAFSEDIYSSDLVTSLRRSFYSSSEYKLLFHEKRLSIDDVILDHQWILPEMNAFVSYVIEQIPGFIILNEGFSFDITAREMGPVIGKFNWDICKIASNVRRENNLIRQDILTDLLDDFYAIRPLPKRMHAKTLPPARAS